MSNLMKPRGDFWKLCLFSFLLVLGRDSNWFWSTVRLVPTLSNCVLTPELAWQVPLVSAGMAGLFSFIPYLIYAFLAALVIAVLSSELGSESICVSFLTAAGLSFAVMPLGLFPVATLFLIKLVASLEWLRMRRSLQLTLSLAIVFLALLTSLEFGVAILFLLCLLIIGDRQAVPRLFRWSALGILVVCASLPFLQPALWKALIRALSWIWLWVPVELIPELQPPMQHPRHWLALLFLGTTGIVLRRSLTFVDSEQNSIGRLCFYLSLLLFCLLGVGCAHYLFIAASAVLLLASLFAVSPAPLNSDRRLPLLFIGAAIVFVVWNTDKLALLAGQPGVTKIDPSQWVDQGIVVLTNLSQSSYWQQGKFARQFRLILDDRWDLFGDQYGEYLAACRDLKEVRIDAYFRDDLQWGGYRRVIDQWGASLLVVDSTELRAIRALSNSPDWKLMGIDAYQTIFGLQHVPRNLPQLNRTLEGILFLEWPALKKSADLENSVVAGNDDEARRVANVLCAARLPYAGLRFIREDFDSDTEKVRTRCYLELAHRVFRHSGHCSLLDQYRGIARLRSEVAEGLWTGRELNAVVSALEGLGLIVDKSDAGGAFSVELQEDMPDQRESIENETPEQFAEQRIRELLVTGQSRIEDDLLDALDESVRPFFLVMLNAPWVASSQLLMEFEQLLHEERQIPSQQLSEIYFYYGCLALETGEVKIAVDALNLSQKLASNSPFGEIRNLYLQQLLR